MTQLPPYAGLLALLALPLGAAGFGCASSQRPAVSAEEVRDGEAPPPAPAAPAESGPAAPAAAPGAATTSTATTTPPPEPPPAKELLSEGQLARLSDLVNSAEIEQGKLAQSRARSAEVKKLAAMMIEHHGHALREQARLIKKLGLSPDDSATAAKLEADADGTLESLKKVDPASFDATYVKSQINGHQKLLDLLDTQLLPAAKTPDVASALRIARAVVEQHLKEAQALRTK
jgi:putative membrane protein